MTLTRLNLILFAIILILSFLVPPLALPSVTTAPREEKIDTPREGEIVAEIFIPDKFTRSQGQLNDYVADRIPIEARDRLDQCERIGVFIDDNIRPGGWFAYLRCVHPKGSLPPATTEPMYPAMELGE